MSIATKERVTWNGKRYHEAIEIGFSEGETGHECFVVNLHSTPAPEPRGGYFTSIPISHSAYRRTYPTKAAYADKGNELVIYSDWGQPHSIKASRKTLDMLVAECELYDVPLASTQS